MIGELCFLEFDNVVEVLLFGLRVFRFLVKC